jgi:flagellar biosynthesis repressor protein FlbT
VKNALQLGLRANERIYINGAVLRVDRKVRLELLNDVTFLLESHVMQPEAATTPIRKIYFLIQSLIMDPALTASLHPPVASAIAAICAASRDATHIAALHDISDLVAAGKAFEALKATRVLIGRECASPECVNTSACVQAEAAE